MVSRARYANAYIHCFRCVWKRRMRLLAKAVLIGAAVAVGCGAAEIKPPRDYPVKPVPFTAVHLTDQGELLYDRAAHQLRLLKARTAKPGDELRDVVGRFHDVAKIQILTPHREVWRLESRNRE